jgi:hypothetical protein
MLLASPGGVRVLGTHDHVLRRNGEPVVHVLTAWRSVMRRRSRVPTTTAAFARLGIVASLSLGLTARAEDAPGPTPPPPACSGAPNRDRATKLQAVLDRQMKLISASSMQSMQDLAIVKTGPDSARKSTRVLKCDEAAMSPKEQREAQAFEARATKWADDTDVRIAAEDQARTDVIVPLCRAVWTIATMREWIAREKSNPAGVVDLEKLHGWVRIPA